jgi:hypothetical protein
MAIDYKKYPSNWKTEIRPEILNRSNGCCEFCGIQNYAVGWRDLDGIFHRTAGNKSHDDAGTGLLKYKEALNLVKHCNELGDDYKLIIIVLTIAHLDHDTTNNDFSNLKALCQRCHNRHDAKFRAGNRKAKKGTLTLF